MKNALIQQAIIHNGIVLFTENVKKRMHMLAGTTAKHSPAFQMLYKAMHGVIAGETHPIGLQHQDREIRKTSTLVTNMQELESIFLDNITLYTATSIDDPAVASLLHRHLARLRTLFPEASQETLLSMLPTLPKATPFTFARMFSFNHQMNGLFGVTDRALLLKRIETQSLKFWNFLFSWSSKEYIESQINLIDIEFPATPDGFYTLCRHWAKFNTDPRVIDLLIDNKPYPIATVDIFTKRRDYCLLRDSLNTGNETAVIKCLQSNANPDFLMRLLPIHPLEMRAYHLEAYTTHREIRALFQSMNNYIRTRLHPAIYQAIYRGMYRAAHQMIFRSPNLANIDSDGIIIAVEERFNPLWILHGLFPSHYLAINRYTINNPSTTFDALSQKVLKNPEETIHAPDLLALVDAIKERNAHRHTYGLVEQNPHSKWLGPRDIGMLFGGVTLLVHKYLSDYLENSVTPTGIKKLDTLVLPAMIGSIALYAVISSLIMQSHSRLYAHRQHSVLGEHIPFAWRNRSAHMTQVFSNYYSMMGLLLCFFVLKNRNYHMAFQFYQSATLSSIIYRLTNLTPANSEYIRNTLTQAVEQIKALIRAPSEVLAGTVPLTTINPPQAANRQTEVKLFLQRRANVLAIMNSNSSSTSTTSDNGLRQRKPIKAPKPTDSDGNRVASSLAM